MTGRLKKKPDRVRVNSTHHQAVQKLAKSLVLNARALDGIIEGIESESHRFVVGVQWHPELLYPRFDSQARILKAFVRAAKSRSSL